MLPDYEIWLDHHLSPIIAKLLNEETGLTVQSSYVLKLNGLSDNEIYSKARKAGNIIIISKDTDLDLIISAQGSPPKLILLKIPNCDNRILFSILKDNIMNAIRLLIDFKKDIIEINP